MDKKVGRPSEYTEEVVNLALGYVSDDESVNYISYSHAIPSIVGLCRVINRARSTVYLWSADINNQFSDILPAINEFQELTTLNGSLTGELNPQIGKLVLGKHGYSDKIATELTGADGGPVETKSAIFEFIPVDSND